MALTKMKKGNAIVGLPAIPEGVVKAIIKYHSIFQSKLVNFNKFRKFRIRYPW